MDMKNRATFMALIGASPRSWLLSGLAGDRRCRSDSHHISGAVPLAGLMMALAWSAPTTADTAMQTYDLVLKRCSAEMPLPTFSASGTLTYKLLAEGPTWQEQFVFIQDSQDEEKVKMDKAFTSAWAHAHSTWSMKAHAACEPSCPC
jgi:hypothetical protein